MEPDIYLARDKQNELQKTRHEARKKLTGEEWGQSRFPPRAIRQERAPYWHEMHPGAAQQPLGWASPPRGRGSQQPPPQRGLPWRGPGTPQPLGQPAEAGMLETDAQLLETDAQLLETEARARGAEAQLNALLAAMRACDDPAEKASLERRAREVELNHIFAQAEASAIRKQSAIARSEGLRAQWRAKLSAAKEASGPRRRQDSCSPRQDSSKGRRNLSPRRRGSSPRRQDLSLRRRDSSPRRQDLSPRRRDSSPRRRRSLPQGRGPRKQEGHPENPRQQKRSREQEGHRQCTPEQKQAREQEGHPKDNRQQKQAREQEGHSQDTRQQKEAREEKGPPHDLHQQAPHQQTPCKQVNLQLVPSKQVSHRQAQPQPAGLALATQQQQDLMQLWPERLGTASADLLTLLSKLLYALHVSGEDRQKPDSPVSKISLAAYDAKFKRVKDLVSGSQVRIPPSPHYRRPASSSPQHHQSFADQLNDANARFLSQSETLGAVSPGLGRLFLSRNPSIPSSTLREYDEAVCSLRVLMFHLQMLDDFAN